MARASKGASTENYGVSRGQGGVAILWRKSLAGASPIKTLVHDRICGIRIQLASGAVLNIYSVYLLSVGSANNYEYTLDDLDEVVTSLDRRTKFIICGDFNGDVGRLGGPRSNVVPNRQGKILASFVEKHGLIVSNMQPVCSGPMHTHVGPLSSSVLNYILVQEDLYDLVKLVGVLEDPIMNLSDHRVVSVVVSLDINVVRQNGSTCHGSPKWTKLSAEDIYLKYTAPLSEDLSRCILTLKNSVHSATDLDHIVEQIIAAIKKAEVNIPKSKYTPNVKPYWTDELSALKRKKIESYRSWVTAGKPRSWENYLYKQYKKDKINFAKKIRRVCREYENQEILNIVQTCEVNRNMFWKLVNNVRAQKSQDPISIKDEKGVVRHELTEVLNVWEKHFGKLGTPRHDEHFDSAHFNMVNDFVKEKDATIDVDEFSADHFSIKEVSDALKRLNTGKSPGIDGVTVEHLKNAGILMVDTLTLLYNHILDIEYIPTNFRRGVQVPLYKGKNTCNLNPNNYRGITLLTVFNKLFEVLLWGRIEPWWVRENVISNLQGACKKGHSCLHSALTIQEALATSMERYGKCFVPYFDVTKAFDEVWIEGLFYRLYKMGITGKSWRLLYMCYKDFKCKVRIQGTYSNPYNLKCGIHQGGFLSLFKYVAYINSLIEDLSRSGMCCEIYKIPSSPVGYADDVASCCLSKYKIDKILDIAYEHSSRWRYNFNPKKCAVLVYGESKETHDKNAPDRIFKLGPHKIPEKVEYDHVGVKACIYEFDDCIISERLAKARKVFNTLTGLGIRKNGLTIAVCNIIFWTVVIPTLTYGCEMWVLSVNDVVNLEFFQRYAARRIQRLPQRCPKESCMYGLGWMRIERVIHVKKLLFIRSILAMKDDETIKKIFLRRLEEFCNDPDKCSQNACRSPILDILTIAGNFNIYNLIKNYIENGILPSKSTWSKRIWHEAWSLEDQLSRNNSLFLEEGASIMKQVLGPSEYLPWWALSDRKPYLIRMAENLAKILSHSSQLREDDYNLKGKPTSHKVCPNCDLGTVESIRHVIMQCPNNERDTNDMFDRLRDIEDGSGTYAIENCGNVLNMVLGAKVPGLLDEQMYAIWEITGVAVNRIYNKIINARTGVG